MDTPTLTGRNAVIFDDGRGHLAPLRDLRPIFDVRTGAFTTIERFERVLGVTPVALYAPDELAAITKARRGGIVGGLAKDHGPVICLNGRCPVPPAAVQSLGEGAALVETNTGDIIAAHLDAADAIKLMDHLLAGGDRPDMEEVGIDGRVLMNRPWHWRPARDDLIRLDLKFLEREIPQLTDPPAGVTVIGKWPPRVHERATLHPGTIFDTTKGTIVIDEGAEIRPGAIISGQVYIGQDTIVLDRAIIKPDTAIGPVCKVAGEVGGTIFQGFSNKAHDGYLGDSFLGEWVNLGASTVNSNLLNTYGDIKAVAQPGGQPERTGEMFLGCTLGDHVKTAIGTRIMTGVVAHTGAMWADTEPMTGCIEPFCWATPKERSRYKLDAFLTVAQAMMHRRAISASNAVTERIKTLHAAQ